MLYIQDKLDKNLTLLASMLLLSSADFFSELTFKKKIFQVQTVYKGHQQMTKVSASKGVEIHAMR